MLSTYRNKCAPNSSPTQLVMPDSLKLLPLYLLSLIENYAFKKLQSQK